MFQPAWSRTLSIVMCVALLMGSLPPPARADRISPTAGTATTSSQQVERAAAPDTSAGSPRAEEQRALPPSGDVASSLQRARELLKSADYDGAIDILSALVQPEQSRIAAQREAYPLLVETYVQLGNAHKYRDQGRATSELNYEKARNLITQCLATKELRHVRPEPPSEFSEETIRMFDEVRNEVFGAFRVADLAPPHAVVLLDADTLRAPTGDGRPGDVDIAIGRHLVIVRAAGYKDLTEEITISPNSTLERPYHLSRKRGRMWYATLATGTIGLVGGVVALVTSGGKTTSTEQPLPDPPPPPSSPQR